MHFRDAGGGGAIAPFPVFGRSVNPIWTGGHMMATILLLAPPSDFLMMRRLCSDFMYLQTAKKLQKIESL